jgi:hypothetical protein
MAQANAKIGSTGWAAASRCSQRCEAEAVLFVDDPTADAAPNQIGLWSASYRLTPAEARLAMYLASGETLRDAATASASPTTMCGRRCGRSSTRPTRAARLISCGCCTGRQACSSRWIRNIWLISRIRWLHHPNGRCAETASASEPGTPGQILPPVRGDRNRRPSTNAMWSNMPDWNRLADKTA